jgi:hypothetical protein
MGKKPPQLDLFQWADERPTAKILSFMDRFLDDIAVNGEWHASDEYANRPLPDQPQVIPLRRRA